MTPGMKKTIIGIIRALAVGGLSGWLLSFIPMPWPLIVLFGCAIGLALYVWLYHRKR